MKDSMPALCSPASVTRTQVAGFDAFVLDSGPISALVIPELGGRVWELHDKVRSRQWIWHRSGVPLSKPVPGAVYDDVWAGGWEELFPNDAPTSFEGRVLPDHGEWWASDWSVSRLCDGPVAILEMSARLSVRQVLCTKEFRIDKGSDTIEAVYRIENLEPEPFHFLFKQHFPVAITPACSLALPGGSVTPVDAQFGNILPAKGPFDWPFATGRNGAMVDLRVIPPSSSRAREFVYVSGNGAVNWCGIDDHEHAATLRMSYDATAMPFLWLFLSYGGWRDCYTAVLEPCTNMPKDLEQARRLGDCARLDRGSTFQTSFRVSLGALPPSWL
jgi:hypothetical protein